MTAPRQILANTTYLVSRRCSERRKLLTPSSVVNQIVLYVLAVSAERFGVLIHAFCVMSNHLHVVLTDPHGRLPAFEQYFSSLVARSCNAIRGRGESFWAPGSYSAVSLLDEASVLDKTAYTLANPVCAGLVRRGADWPGLWSSPEAIGGAPITVQRPRTFFRAEGGMPAEAALRLVPPPTVSSADEFRCALTGEVERREAEAAERLASARRDVEGADRVLAQDPFSRPVTEEERRRLKPRIACRDRQRRVDAIAKLKAFWRAYREVWNDYASGVRSVVFPLGTYWMSVTHGLPCAAAG